MQITGENYITERVDDRIQYFMKKSIQHRRRYKMLKIIEIVSGFLIAVFCTIPMESIMYKVISVSLASLGLLCEGIISLYNAKEHWISYQNTAELLEKEKFLFRYKSEKYANDDSLEQFVSSCETIILEEIVSWKNIQSKEVKLPNSNIASGK